jgi:hypothetical protein
VVWFGFNGARAAGGGGVGCSKLSESQVRSAGKLRPPDGLGKEGANDATSRLTAARNHLLSDSPPRSPSLAHWPVEMPPAPDGKIYSATYSNVSAARTPFSALPARAAALSSLFAPTSSHIAGPGL